MQTDNQIQDPDRFYDELNAVHGGLTDAQSADFNARLVLVLANQVGDNAVLSQCIELARQTA
jgi:hypothetical protein